MRESATREARLAAVSMRVAAGEIYGFLGPNGAGTTTTLRMLAGLIRPSAGTATVQGRTPGDPEVLRGIGVLIEGPGFYPYLSGRDNLRVLARYRGHGDAEVETALERVGLADRAGDRFRTYSLGMKQRLGVGAAMLGERGGDRRVAIGPVGLEIDDAERGERVLDVLSRERDALIGEAGDAPGRGEVDEDRASLRLQLGDALRRPDIARAGAGRRLLRRHGAFDDEGRGRGDEQGGDTGRDDAQDDPAATRDAEQPDREPGDQNGDQRGEGAVCAGLHGRDPDQPDRGREHG